jgi:hypothetical protein
VSWGPEANAKTPTARIEASVHNDSPYRVTDVELEVEGLSADQHSVGQRFVWAVGDIDPGSESSFVTEAIPGAATYRITVVSFDIVSAEPPAMRTPNGRRALSEPQAWPSSHGLSELPCRVTGLVFR